MFVAIFFLPIWKKYHKFSISPRKKKLRVIISGMLYGILSSRTQKIVLGWLEIRVKELLDNWEYVRKTKKSQSIHSSASPKSPTLCRALPA